MGDIGTDSAKLSGEANEMALSVDEGKKLQPLSPETDIVPTYRSENKCTKICNADGNEDNFEKSAVTFHTNFTGNMHEKPDVNVLIPEKEDSQAPITQIKSFNGFPISTAVKNIDEDEVSKSSHSNNHLHLLDRSGNSAELLGGDHESHDIVAEVLMPSHSGDYLHSVHVSAVKNIEKDEVSKSCHSDGCLRLVDRSINTAEFQGKNHDSGVSVAEVLKPSCSGDYLQSVDMSVNTAGTLENFCESNVGVAKDLETQQPVILLDSNEESQDSKTKIDSTESSNNVDAVESLLFVGTSHPTSNNGTTTSPKIDETPVVDQAPIETLEISSSNADLSHVDVTEHQLPTHEMNTAVIVSTDLEGWQRFDAETNDPDRIPGLKHNSNGDPDTSLELWEKLLDVGLEVSADPVASQVGLFKDTGTIVESPLHDENQHWLASPGNPFIEGIDRLSNFSEADGFATSASCLELPQLHHDKAQLFVMSSEGLAQSSETDEGKTAGQKGSEESRGFQLNGVSDGSKRSFQQRFPSFSDIRTSSRPRDPSLSLTLNELDSAHCAGSNVHGHEAATEKWEANFDLMVPAFLDARSLSLPREASGLNREDIHAGCSNEAPVVSQSKPTGFLSPKLSPMVKRVVNKVRTVPVQVFDAVNNGVENSDSSQSKEVSNWPWYCCICCSRRK
ncbi:hypothetical protein KP509_25G059700 [Ceratopteris richardii]|uniref:Uncharacterized protein n=2 Tax=Ceratopteris richardii TaxID=49495 RepID=A0A8T2RTH6_CERRI|nr:hypothetical protein KP509_25G059700 [Ceratopteris richardii]